MSYLFAFFILFMRFSWQEYWSGLPFPSPGDHVLSELFTMTYPSWVALHGMAHSFIVTHGPSPRSMKGLCISLYSQKLWLFHIVYGCESWTIKKSECPRIDASGRESRSSWACGLENKLWMDGSAAGRTLTRLSWAWRLPRSKSERKGGRCWAKGAVDLRLNREPANPRYFYQ